MVSKTRRYIGWLKEETDFVKDTIQIQREKEETMYSKNGT